MRFERVPAPEFLVLHGPRWTGLWRARWAKGVAFEWYQHEGQPVNQRLLPLLLAMTDGRCAYCDHFPLSVEARETIDHHKPKSREEFVHLAFVWDNLYVVCWFCNDTKRDRWDEDLLRPDAEDYDFFRYFDCDAATGLITPLPIASEDERRRAERTIEILGLNQGNRPLARRLAARAPPEPPELRPYRFLYA